MFSTLDSIDWNGLGYHTYGRNDEIPEAIRNLLSPDAEVREAARGFLLGEGQDFGDIYDTIPTGQILKANQNHDYTPGPVVLFGSGETSPSGRKVFEHVLRALHLSPRVALLETPAGFELNSEQVIGRVAEFLERHLRNYGPQTITIPARKRGTPFSPDDPDIVRPLLDAEVIFMGPGSPTYATRQLHDSLAWHYLVARHHLGASLVLASAAVIAAGAHTLPVYEIYKVGEDLHWEPGLDFFGPYGLPLVFVPHWNNNDGGEELDTSRSFMGQQRFAALLALLPAGLTVLGIDENTALIMDLQRGTGQVMGQGGVTLLRTPAAEESPQQLAKRYANGELFSLTECGPFHPPEPGAGIPGQAWNDAIQAVTERERENEPPEAVRELIDARLAARQGEDWETADRLREEIRELGWDVLDTPDGPSLHPADESPDA